MSDHLEIEITDAVILDVTARVLSSFDEIHSMSKRFFDGVVDGISQKLGQKSWPGMNVKHKRDSFGEAFIEIISSFILWISSIRSGTTNTTTSAARFTKYVRLIPCSCRCTHRRFRKKGT